MVEPVTPEGSLALQAPMLPPKWGSSDTITLRSVFSSARPEEIKELVRVQLSAPRCISVTAAQDRVPGSVSDFSDALNFSFSVGCGGVMTEFGLQESGQGLQGVPQGVYQFVADYLSVKVFQNPSPGVSFPLGTVVGARAYAAPVPFGYGLNPTVRRVFGSPVATPVVVALPSEALRKLVTMFNDTDQVVTVSFPGGRVVDLDSGEYYETNFAGRIDLSSPAGAGFFHLTRMF